jgi:hypothetical protein
MPLSIPGWRPVTAHDDFYEKLTTLSPKNREKFVSGKAYLFGIATVIGFILNRRSAQTSTMQNGMFYPLNSYRMTEKYPMFLQFFDYLCDHYARGVNEREKLNDIEHIADGGIEFLMEEFDNQNINRLDLSLLLQKVNELLDNRESET